ncbi:MULTISPECIES: helix-turn-helix domain-containing protein [Sphingomonas]|uniref:helix-turn-helix domain-containing protein n=1 Tax=Sphingomonas TaxID=13687 RepID=UPI00082A7CE8|nr:MULTISPECIES: helix-turn-helix transcriptional regulator [Sphingomonas]
MTPPTEPAADVIDFTVLSAAERDILTLLARGHTAKSIAALTGRSEASVNERLRQARRKTQLGSSRELARRFAAQENRDEKSDLDPPAAGGDAPLRLSVRKGVIVMFVSVIASIGIAVSLVSPDTAQEARLDPALDRLLAPARSEPRGLALQLAGEARDAAWAGAGEAALERHYAGLRRETGVVVDKAECRRTLCQVIGTLPASADHARTNAAMEALQGAAAAPAGLTLESAAFGSGGRFVIFWRRAGAQ